MLGEESEEFLVHSEAIARLSPALNALMNGPLQESQAELVRWNDVEPEDFIRFCQFAYTGNYTLSKPVGPTVVSNITNLQGEGIASDSVDQLGSGPITPWQELAAKPSTSMQENASNGWGCPYVWTSEGGWVMLTWGNTWDSTWENTWDDSCGHGTNKKKTDRKKFHVPRIIRLQTEFADRVLYPDEHDPSDGSVSYCSSEPDATPFFLAHARLYVLASKYDVVKLKELSEKKLHKAFTQFLSAGRANSIIELITYIYENTHASSDGAIRALLVEYITLWHNHFGDLPEFRELLEEGGQFVLDFWSSIQSRLL